MLDIYLIKYIEQFLSKCSYCNSYDINKIDQYCCICKKKYCSKCKHKLYDLVSFYKSKYCCDCYIYATML